MLQMAGVLIFAIGIPQMFASIDGGPYFDNTVIVLGYVVMRVAMIIQWARVARQNPDARKVANVYMVAIGVAQVGWLIQAFTQTSLTTAAIWTAGLLLVELGGPIVAERRLGGTPWHAHHIAERYGLLVIIALGEGMIGTMAAMSGPFTAQGWSLDFVLILTAGVVIVFGMWWSYFVIPWGEVLARHRNRSFGWGYGHILIFGSVAAVGAGLHVAG